MTGNIQKFIGEVVAELKKASWSTRQELIESTWIVLLSSAILGVFIGIVDLMLANFIRLIIY